MFGKYLEQYKATSSPGRNNKQKKKFTHVLHIEALLYLNVTVALYVCVCVSTGGLF